MRAALGTRLTGMRDALAWRLRAFVGDERVDRSLVRMAHRWRPMLGKPVFIGIAGSGGKTTTKELLLGMLSARRRGTGTTASLNALPEVAKTILGVRPTDDFCVAELDEKRPGELDHALDLLRPDVGIVTVVGSDHWSAYGSREAIAAELAKLVASLSASGTAVLNADDPLVRAMAANCAGKVISYGTSSDAYLRAEEISSVWPNRLQMTLARDGERVKVRTQLCGAHWAPSVLGAVGGALAVGMSLDECARLLGSVAPFEGRMQPVTTPKGVTFIRDDFKAPLWTLDACFEFMKEAQAKRKIMVVGDAFRRRGPTRGRSTPKLRSARRRSPTSRYSSVLGRRACSRRANGAASTRCARSATCETPPSTSTPSRATAISYCSKERTRTITCFGSSWRATTPSPAGARIASGTRSATRARIEASLGRSDRGRRSRSPVSQHSEAGMHAGCRRAGDHRPWQSRVPVRRHASQRRLRGRRPARRSIGSWLECDPGSLDRPRSAQGRNVCLIKIRAP